MERRSRFDAAMEKRKSVQYAEAAGQVSDSGAVRLSLIERVNSGEITLNQAKAELKRIKRDGKRSGKLTREQVFSRG